MIIRVIVTKRDLSYVCHLNPTGWKCGCCARGTLILPERGDRCRVCKAEVYRVDREADRRTCSMCETGEPVSDDGEHFVGGDLIRCRKDTR